MKKFIELFFLQIIFIASINNCFAQDYANSSLDYEVGPFSCGYATFKKGVFFGIIDSLNNIVCEPKYDYIILNGAQNAIVILSGVGASSIVVEKEFFEKKIELFENHFALGYDSTGLHYINEKGKLSNSKVAIKDEIILLRSYHLSRIASSTTGGYGNVICSDFFDAEGKLVRRTCIQIQSSVDQINYEIYDKNERLIIKNRSNFGSYISSVNESIYLRQDALEKGEYDTIYFKELNLDIDSVSFSNTDLLGCKYLNKNWVNQGSLIAKSHNNYCLIDSIGNIFCEKYLRIKKLSFNEEYFVALEIDSSFKINSDYSLKYSLLTQTGGEIFVQNYDRIYNHYNEFVTAIIENDQLNYIKQESTSDSLKLYTMESILTSYCKNKITVTSKSVRNKEQLLIKLDNEYYYLKIEE